MKKFRYLLLDAGPIIKLFSLRIWDEFIRHCDVTIARIIADHQALYTEDGSTRIDLRPYEVKGLIKVVDLDTSVVTDFHNMFDPLYKGEIHPGEKETLAFLCSHSEKYYLCSADGAVFRALGVLAKGRWGISLEEILANVGLTHQLEWKFSKRFREHYTRQGQTDAIQGKGLVQS